MSHSLEEANNAPPYPAECPCQSGLDYASILEGVSAGRVYKVPVTAIHLSDHICPYMYLGTSSRRSNSTKRETPPQISILHILPSPTQPQVSRHTLSFSCGKRKHTPPLLHLPPHSSTTLTLRNDISNLSAIFFREAHYTFNSFFSNISDLDFHLWHSKSIRQTDRLQSGQQIVFA